MLLPLLGGTGTGTVTTTGDWLLLLLFAGVFVAGTVVTGTPGVGGGAVGGATDCDTACAFDCAGMATGPAGADAIRVATVVSGEVAALESFHDGLAKASVEVRPSTAVAVKPVAKIRADDATCLDFLRGILSVIFSRPHNRRGRRSDHLHLDDLQFHRDLHLRPGHRHFRTHRRRPMVGVVHLGDRWCREWK